MIWTFHQICLFPIYIFNIFKIIIQQVIYSIPKIQPIYQFPIAIFTLFHFDVSPYYLQKLQFISLWIISILLIIISLPISFPLIYILLLFLIFAILLLIKLHFIIHYSQKSSILHDYISTIVVLFKLII